MEADILGGVQLGFKTILVLSGGTREDDIERYAYRPDKVVGSIADLDPTQLARDFTAAVAPPRSLGKGRLTQVAEPGEGAA